MYNCIFTSHCIKSVCDKSCPALAESTFLMEQNGITMNSSVFRANPTQIEHYSKLIDNAPGRVQTVIEKDTSAAAELVAYCGICKHWKGSRLHTVVYNLKLSQYLDSIQGSWNSLNSSTSTLDDLEYQKIWIAKAKILIISNIDFVNFKDFQAQTLLSLVQQRSNPEFGTIIVSPNPQALVGSGLFFPKLQDMLRNTTVK